VGKSQKGIKIISLLGEKAKKVEWGKEGGVAQSRFTIERRERAAWPAVWFLFRNLGFAVREASGGVQTLEWEKWIWQSRGKQAGWVSSLPRPSGADMDKGSPDAKRLGN